MVNKLTLIDHIQQINGSAPADWLALFDISALNRYLEHLQYSLEPRGRGSTWVRQAETPAIVTSESDI